MPTSITSTVIGICDNYLRMDGDMTVENNALENTSLRFMSLPGFNIISTPLLLLETYHIFSFSRSYSIVEYIYIVQNSINFFRFTFLRKFIIHHIIREV